MKKEHDKFLYRFGLENNSEVCIVQYILPKDDEIKFGIPHTGYAEVLESFSEYKPGDRYKWSDDFVIRTIENEKLKDFHEYLV